jgi:hypothetical protein
MQFNTYLRVFKFKLNSQKANYKVSMRKEKETEHTHKQTKTPGL